MPQVMTGKILTPMFMATVKENVHRVLSTYKGVYCDHYRQKIADRDLYGDQIAEAFVYLGKHLVHLTSYDYDHLCNDVVHFEDDLPIEVLLDPEIDWNDYDEVVIKLDLQNVEKSRRLQVVDVRTVNKAGVSIYKKASLATVRLNRVNLEKVR